MDWERREERGEIQIERAVRYHKEQRDATKIQGCVKKAAYFISNQL